MGLLEVTSQRLMYKCKSQMNSTLAAAVLNDDGTGFIEIGYAGIIEPSSHILSLISAVSNFDLINTTKLTDGYDFFVGGEADAAPIHGNIPVQARPRRELDAHGNDVGSDHLQILAL